jgi:mannose/cellobiose epimerase-like protein (N-acyl-D-glucosamine 2-epimerase family)
MTVSLKTLQSELKTWLFEAALPLWWETGGDRIKGGFYERINLDGTPDDANRRTRVAARQVYSYALAQYMGYQEESNAAIDKGLAWLSGPARGPDGELYATLTPTGEIVRGEFDFYDYAFAMLAFATAYKVRPDNKELKAAGEAIRDKLVSSYKHPTVGFEESNPRTLPLKANPHMHMFEACLAWIEAGGDDKWREIAAEIADLCLAKFLHPVTGSLREFFDGDWNPMSGNDGRIVEPGHQYEWAWLLIRWSQLTGDARFIAPARKLVEIGETYGTDPKRGVSFNELWDDFTPKDERARLWPQTERMKAYSALFAIAETEDERVFARDKALLAAKGLMLYFNTDIRGLYRDKMNVDGSFVIEPAPASSLYHIICAIDEFSRMS